MTPHGMLNSWALSHKRWKKVLYYRCIEKRTLTRVRAIHVFNTHEERTCRDLGLTNNIYIIPRGPSCEVNEVTEGDVTNFRNRHRLNEDRLMLFLGRIHPVKGLDILIKAFAMVSTYHRNWRLVVGGPDEGGYWAKLSRLIDGLKLNGRVTHLGEISGLTKDIAFAASDILVLTSYSEAQSMAILEAMNSGLPVLITKTCHFHDVSEVKAGLEVEPTAESIAAGLAEMFGLPKEELREMGERGRNLVGQHYSWSVIACQMLSVYEDLIKDAI